ncbi:hypothetical protein ACFLWO_04190 [Chloroflexota bacterium]
MRRGCISLEDAQCYECHRIIPYSERYLAIDEEDGVEVGQGETAHYCVECALQKGYAYYKDGEKGERILTFFP